MCKNVCQTNTEMIILLEAVTVIAISGRSAQKYTAQAMTYFLSTGSWARPLIST